ncbi:MAG: cytochrome c4 [Proteobacteria bacterium]|nr:cytochrome c4 [Pseudomonadota bacterium]
MNRIGRYGVIAVLLLVVVGGAISFFWLPQAQLQRAHSWFGAFCVALGVPQPGPIVNAREADASQVVLDHHLLGRPGAADIGHGATLALRCTMCHGPTGISYADSPNLAGQYASVTYKQLRDYQSGARSNGIMTPMARSLSDTDLRQLAAYYASLPRPAIVMAGAAPAIVKWGDPMRNIAPCGSCHGDIAHTAASPWLRGEPRAYIVAQLREFASGRRRNDINEQMRAMAHGMTAAEMMAAADYYSGQAATQ